MPTRWECRYSSSEMLYLELRDNHIVTFLHHSPNSVERFPFTEVLAGKHDAMINTLFGQNALPQIKAAIKHHMDVCPLLPNERPHTNVCPLLPKEQLREIHRRESH